MCVISFTPKQLIIRFLLFCFCVRLPVHTVGQSDSLLLLHCPPRLCLHASKQQSVPTTSLRRTNSLRQPRCVHCNSGTTTEVRRYHKTYRVRQGNEPRYRNKHDRSEIVSRWERFGNHRSHCWRGCLRSGRNRRAIFQFPFRHQSLDQVSLVLGQKVGTFTDSVWTSAMVTFKSSAHGLLCRREDSFIALRHHTDTYFRLCTR